MSLSFEILKHAAKQCLNNGVNPFTISDAVFEIVDEFLDNGEKDYLLYNTNEYAEYRHSNEFNDWYFKNGRTLELPKYDKEAYNDRIIDYHIFVAFAKFKNISMEEALSNGGGGRDRNDVNPRYYCKLAIKSVPKYKRFVIRNYDEVGIEEIVVLNEFRRSYRAEVRNT